MSANTTTVKVKKTDLSGTSTAYKAVAVVILILLVIFFLCQKYMTSGLTAGGVKG